DRAAAHASGRRKLYAGAEGRGFAGPYLAQPEEPESGQAAGLAGGQMGDRLQGHPAEHRAADAQNPSELPARGLS
ncbi:hypothetical protein, partial [Acinetobacter baumannii]|uniref:hypothetical protein n=1 Tax=Acinetobacter baumannii TaxID=470 RepID=UPI0031F33A24